MAVRTIDKIISVDATRFGCAVERLEKFRGIPNAAEILISRMTAKKGVWNLVFSTQGLQFQFTDYGMVE